MSGPHKTAPGEFFVSLEIPERDASVLTDSPIGDNRIGGVVTREPSDGTASVVVQLKALNDVHAWVEAEDAYEGFRLGAGLKPDRPVSGTVVRLRDVPLDDVPRSAPAARTPSRDAPPSRRDPEQVLQEASDALSRALTGYAMSRAATACEVAVREALLRLIAHRARLTRSTLEDLILRRSLSDPKVCRLWDELAPDRIRERPFWSAYKTGITIRNLHAHEAHDVTEDEAKSFLAAARALCDHVKVSMAERRD